MRNKRAPCSLEARWESGVELLADGLSEIRQLVHGMSQAQRLAIKIGQP
jgi:hypothetical protein